MTEPKIFHEKMELYLARLAAAARPPHWILNVMEVEGSRRAFPMIGPEVGRILYLYAKLGKQKRILELGSGFGYSAMWWALGAPEAEIHLTDWDQANLDKAREYAGEAGVARQFHCHRGDALAIARELPGPWDIIFVDIDKTEYPAALEFAAGALQPGGTVFFDNMLWRGLVAEEKERWDEMTEAVARTTKAAFDDPRWEAGMLPIRDGLLLAVRQQD